MTRSPLRGPTWGLTKRPIRGRRRRTHLESTAVNRSGEHHVRHDEHRDDDEQNGNLRLRLGARRFQVAWKERQRTRSTSFLSWLRRWEFVQRSEVGLPSIIDYYNFC